MFGIKGDLPRMANGQPDLDVWLDVASGFSSASRSTAVRVFGLIVDSDARQRGLQLVELLLELKMDVTTVMAGMTLFAVQRGSVDTLLLPNEVASIVNDVLRLSSTNVLSFHDTAVQSSESKSQADNVRQMLIALIDDPRVAVVKLAEQVVALRLASAGQEPSRVRAREALEFFAPLAGRLGIWQLKWTLEDLAFRYLYPGEYRQIADNLDARREARERQVEAIRQDLEFRLTAKGIDAEVQGRAKNIYSIWRKMNHKSIDFSKVRDVQAVRVLVGRVEDCYKALGVVHTSWPHIPNEFDDYIANPKENGYRSIHTAVIGPVGMTLEVQIRTREMHDESELGVCAHWAYKEPGKGGAPGAGDSMKIDWLRSVLEWHDALDARLPNAYAPHGVYANQDRIFVTTPRGHVLDLSPNATPVDFAYRVHTEVGHRCRGAYVDGRRVPLNRRLATGECVEIDTGDAEAPRREWLNPALGYVNTSRARTKIQAWFKSQVAESNISAGRALVEETAARLGLSADIPRLAASAGYAAEDGLLLAVGVGDQPMLELVQLMARESQRGGKPDAGPQDAEEHTGSFEGVVVQGRDRDGLLRDITAAVAEMAIPVVASNALAEIPGEKATISMEMHVADLAELARAIDRLRRIPDVQDVRRAQAR